MEMMFTNISALSQDWRAWIVAALVVLKASQSIFFCLRCPVVRGSVEIDEAMIAAGKAFSVRPTLRYLATMTGGITLAIGGLYLLHDANFGPIALGALVVGVFMFMTEPNRLFVQGATMGVFAAAGDGDEAMDLSRDRLRSAHVGRAMTEATIAAAVLATVLFI